MCAREGVSEQAFKTKSLQLESSLSETCVVCKPERDQNKRFHKGKAIKGEQDKTMLSAFRDNVRGSACGGTIYRGFIFFDII